MDSGFCRTCEGLHLGMIQKETGEEDEEEWRRSRARRDKNRHDDTGPVGLPPS